MKVFEVQKSFGIDSLTLVEKPEPRPAAGQVLLKMRAWSLNYRDLLVVKGLYNPKIQMPFVPLSDGAGEVVEIGAGVTRVKKGDRVAACFMPDWIDGEVTEAKSKSALGGGGTGMLAEYMVLHENAVVPVPEHLSNEDAATLPCAAVTSWHALITAGAIKPGDTVLIQGTGGVSLFALQFARLNGARVVATSSSDDKLNRVAQLGAAEGINYKKNPDWDKNVRQLAPEGVDHIVEVGGAGTLGKSFKCVKMGGTISLIGVLSGGGEVNPTPLLMKKVRLQGIYVGSRAMFEAMNRAISLHKLRPVIDRVFPLEEIRAALRHMEAGAHFGKICIRA